MLRYTRPVKTIDLVNVSCYLMSNSELHISNVILRRYISSVLADMNIAHCIVGRDVKLCSCFYSFELWENNRGHIMLDICQFVSIA